MRPYGWAIILFALGFATGIWVDVLLNQIRADLDDDDGDPLAEFTMEEALRTGRPVVACRNDDETITISYGPPIGRQHDWPR